MILYHYSNGLYEKLKDVKSKNGIWLTTSEDGYNGQNWLFRYKVEINDDCRLKEKTFEGNRTNGKIRWYTYQDNELNYLDVKCLNVDFSPLVELIRRFRGLIECTDFSKIPEEKIFLHFPQGCCGDTSFLLWNFLHETFSGKYDEDIAYRQGIHNQQSHTWLEYRQFIIIDITADQFPDIFEKVVITKDKDWYKQFEFHQHQNTPTVECDFAKMSADVRDRLFCLYNLIVGK